MFTIKIKFSQKDPHFQNLTNFFVPFPPLKGQNPLRRLETFSRCPLSESVHNFFFISVKVFMFLLLCIEPLVS